MSRQRSFARRPLGLEVLEQRRVFAGRAVMTTPASELAALVPAKTAYEGTVAEATKVAIASSRLIADQNAKATNIRYDANIGYEWMGDLIRVEGTADDDTVRVTKLRTGETQITLQATRNGVTVLSQIFTTGQPLTAGIHFDAHAGDDTLINTTNLETWADGGVGNDRLVGGDSYDGFFGGEGDDTLIGNGGHNVFSGGLGNDTLDGGPGSDTLWGDEGQDRLVGYAGDDFLFGGDNADVLNGGTGSDYLDGGTGKDVLSGDEDPDEIHGGDQDDTILGGDGNDLLYGDAGMDRIWGGNDEDELFGGDGDDWLFGGSGDDWLWGGQGNDKLFGQLGTDVLFGDNGDDYLDGGIDGVRDYMIGGLGNDRYRGDWSWEPAAFGRRRVNEICLDVDTLGVDQFW